MAFRTDSRILALDNLQSYLASNLDLLDEDVRADILGTGKGRPILTKTRDSAPTRYGLESKTANSLIADGCIIEGEVRNSVIFRGVRVKKGAVVENSVIMAKADDRQSVEQRVDSIVADGSEMLKA